MAYIAGLILTALFFLALHYFTEVTKRQKITISIVFLLLILSATLFNKYSADQRDQMLSAVLKFKQGKSIICNEQEVNASNYTLSIGTYTFIGKENTPNYAEMIPATSCR